MALTIAEPISIDSLMESTTSPVDITSPEIIGVSKEMEFVCLLDDGTINIDVNVHWIRFKKDYSMCWIKRRYTLRFIQKTILGIYVQWAHLQMDYILSICLYILLDKTIWGLYYNRSERSAITNKKYARSII